MHACGSWLNDWGTTSVAMYTNCASLFLLVVILDVSNQQTPEIQTAVEGVSTNINIPCNLGRREGAPFWFINGTVYELFQIPIFFPSIPNVDSFTHLTIPEVRLELNNTFFQCAILDENDFYRLGNAIKLIVELR